MCTPVFLSSENYPILLSSTKILFDKGKTVEAIPDSLLTTRKQYLFQKNLWTLSIIYYIIICYICYRMVASHHILCCFFCSCHHDHFSWIPHNPKNWPYCIPSGTYPPIPHHGLSQFLCFSCLKFSKVFASHIYNQNSLWIFENPVMCSLLILLISRPSH